MKLHCSLPYTFPSSEIEVQKGLLRDAKHLVTILRPLGARFACITDESVCSLYGKNLCEALAEEGLAVSLFTFPSGESYKTRQTKELLENHLLQEGFGSDTCIIALGGGVVTDLAGYVAATYCRGIALVFIPTSLTGMVDASLGGKTAVNVPQGKNLVGALYPAHKILIDSSLLETLPEKEKRNGLVEMIKHGIVASSAHFSYLESLPPLEEKGIVESFCIKKEIVEHPEKSKRNLLNFGHTIGHALESVTNHALSHGEAVALGILIESHIALQLGFLAERDWKRISALLRAYGLPLRLPCKVDIAQLEKAMSLDKKSKEGKPRFVMIDGIGSALVCDSSYCMAVEPSLVHKAFWLIV